MRAHLMVENQEEFDAFQKELFQMQHPAATSAK
jgi:hypothetical protein